MVAKSFLILVFLLAILAGTTVRAEDPLTMWVAMDVFSSTRTFDDSDGAGGVGAGLKYVYDVGSVHTFNFDGNVRREWPENSTKFILTEGNWQYRGTWADVWLGQQRIFWGKTDGINPTDFFTPHDYTVLRPFEEDYRLSVPAVRVDVAVDDCQTLSLVAQMFFIASEVPQGEEWGQIAERSPDTEWPQLGLRWSSTGPAIDWAASAFHGLLNMPLFAFDPTADRESMLFQHYAELTAFGADLARNFGRFGFRAEGAWLIPEVEDTRQSIEPYAFLVTGFDRGEDDWNINLQLVARYTPDGDQVASTDPMAAVVEGRNAINFGQQTREQYGYTCRIAANWMNQTLQAELFAVHYFRPGNTLMRPLFSYAINDRDKLTVGAEHYSGPADSFYGQAEENNTFFFEYKHYF